MMLPQLTIIPAGAGSGKTYSIQQQLCKWIVEGKIAPEHIVAVTFTEAAAAELRERIRGELLNIGHIEDALKLDQAYISTIHGFGLRVLTEFAFDYGHPPKLRLLNEDEENTLIRLALARTDKADVITSNLSGFGYKYEYNSGKSAEEIFRDVLLTIIYRLRSIGWKEESTDYSNHAKEWIRQKYGATGDGEAFTSKLYAQVENLLSVFPENLAHEYGTNKTAKDALQNDFNNLKNALKDDALATDWNLWKCLRTLRQSKRGAPLPDGYDELACAIIDAANALPHHPGPLAHETSHIEALLTAGQEVLVHYSEAKRTSGLVDYSDMITLARDVLNYRPNVLDSLVKRIDCLVVDEFQDTNPIQFSFLWLLKVAGVPTFVVGDLKQAIMGFQGADPQLFDALMQHNQKVSSPLTKNWRSQPRLMEFINAISPGLFGESYISLDPKGNESELDPLEVVSFPDKAKNGQHAIRAVYVGQRLKELLEDPNQKVVDVRTQEYRRLRGGDIALLCPTHNMLIQYANILRSIGLRVRLQEDDWFMSRVIKIMWNALAYVSNPADRHAALYLSVTELGSLSLKEALSQLMDDGKIKEPLLEKLDKLTSEVADRTVYALVIDTISSLGLFDIISVWPHGEQERANLLRLKSEASEFMNANKEALASGGFHGSGVQSFLAWLSSKVQGKDSNNQPDPRVLDEDAIELVTWHSSKGREWSVVGVCGLDKKIRTNLPNLNIGYSTFEDLSQILDYAQVEYSPSFAAPETNDLFKADLKISAETNARRLLYVAMTRARNKLILEWPSYLEGKDNLTYWSIIAQELGVKCEDGLLVINEKSFPCIIKQGGSDLPVDGDINSTPEKMLLPTIGRRAIKRGPLPEILTHDSIAPSKLLALNNNKEHLDLMVERYGDGLDIEIGLTGATLGIFLHRCFEVLGANPEAAKRLPEITNTDISEDALKKITSNIEGFEDWLQQNYKIKYIDRELPLLTLDESGSFISGTADMVIHMIDGVWIIDHKSDQVDDVKSSYNSYRPQLEYYIKALASEGIKVLGVGINFIRRTEVVLERL
ncbi:UvrD-helicase domain-containing protein [Candidatus Latescibacterota bacterium]